MHPDQATDSIVDAAVMYSKPFAVVVITFHGTPCPPPLPSPCCRRRCSGCCCCCCCCYCCCCSCYFRSSLVQISASRPFYRLTPHPEPPHLNAALLCLSDRISRTKKVASARCKPCPHPFLVMTAQMLEISNGRLLLLELTL